MNRLNANTGPEWIQDALNQLDATLLSAQVGERRRIPLHIWWGWLDGMVPRKGQCRSSSPFDLRLGVAPVDWTFNVPPHRVLSPYSPPDLIRMGSQGNHDWRTLTGSMAQQDFGETFRES